MDLKVSNLTRKHVRNRTWPKEKKLQAVAQYLALGNMKLVSATTGVEHGLLRQWKMQPWWKEFEREIRATENLQLDDKLTKIVDRSLDAVADRLENGDFIYDVKTGQVKRKAVNMKDAAKVSVDLLTKRELLRGNATNRTESTQIPMVDQLKMLAAEFARMNTGKSAEVIEVHTTEIEDAVEVVHDIGDASEVFSDDEYDDSEEMDDDSLGGESGTDDGEGRESSDLGSDPEGLHRNNNP